MTLEKLFKRNLAKAIKAGYDHNSINRLAGKTEHKIVLSEAEGEAGKMTYNDFITDKLWNDNECIGGWLFGSLQNESTIGLVPQKLARQRLGLNSNCWANYKPII